MPRGRSGRRTDYSWSNFGDSIVAADIGQQGDFGPAVSTVLAPQTLMRIRGKVGVVLDTGGANESAIILCGIMVGNTDLIVGGGPPELFTGQDDEASWVWQGALYVNSGAEAAVVTDFLSDSLDVDSKAMRKMKPGQAIAFVHQSPAELAVDQGGTYDLTYFFHCLNGT